MKSRQLACVALFAAVCAASVQVVNAFYDDTHYSLTYYIARSCGYTPMQALRVASADVAVDSLTSLTEPVQAGNVTDLSEDAQNARVRFHAMWNARLPMSDPWAGKPSLADRANKGRELELTRLATEQKNPGVWLHYVQDEEPHLGYTSWGGHWVPPSTPKTIAAVAAPLAPVLAVPFMLAVVPSLRPARSGLPLPYGATTDFLSYNQAHSFEMVIRTIDTLTTFLREAKTHQRSGGMRCDANAILLILAQLVGANPVSVQAAQYAAKVAEAAEAVGMSTAQLESAFKKLGIDEQATKAGPVVGNADAVIARSLALQLDSTPYKPFPRRLPYDYDLQGRTPSKIFALYGTLNLDVEAAAGKQAEVSVWAAPTRVGEAPYLLECKAASGSTQFDNMPVGDLIVQRVADGKMARTAFSFQATGETVTITGGPEKKKDEEKSRCSQPAAAAAATAFCANTMLTSLVPMTQPQLAQANALEKDLDAKLEDCKKDEQPKKETNAQRTQPTPGKSGGGVGTAVKLAAGVGGAVTAGIFLKSALDDLSALDGTSTSSPTTTTTAPSTANYMYANWNCNNGPQCTAVLGHNTGSVGPFCSAAPCNDWHAHQGGGTSCTSAPQFIVYSSPRSGCSTTWNGF